MVSHPDQRSRSNAGGLSTHDMLDNPMFAPVGRKKLRQQPPCPRSRKREYRYHGPRSGSAKKRHHKKHVVHAAAVALVAGWRHHTHDLGRPKTPPPRGRPNGVDGWPRHIEDTSANPAIFLSERRCCRRRGATRCPLVTAPAFDIVS
jgi:hypothetical protein